MPPSARQIPATRRPATPAAPAGPAGSGAPAAAARAANSAAASPPSPPGGGTDSPGTGYTASCGTTRRIRLVTSTARFGQADSSRSVSTATAFTRCSQLSSTSSARRSPSAAASASWAGRDEDSSAPRQASTAAGSSAGSVTGTRSAYQVAPNQSATSAATASASLVLPIPPGPTAETSRDVASTAARAARSPSRQTNEVSGAGSRGEAPGPVPVSAARYPAASRTSSRWVPTHSLRRSAATWLSTVRTEMNSRPAISAWLRCSPSRARTSVSRPDTPASARADALVTRATRSSLPQIRSSPRRIRGYYGCRGQPAARTLSAGQVTGRENREAVMGSADVQGELWGRHPQTWATFQESQMRPLYDATLDALEPLAGRALLDAGCGAGLALRLAADRGAAVSGLDASAPLLEVARERSPEASLRTGDIQALPYDDAGFDVVTSFNAIQYAADPAAAVAQLARICRAGGQVAIGVWGDPGRCQTEALFARLRSLAPPPPGTPAPLAVSDPGVVESLLEKAGLTVTGGGETAASFRYADHEQAWTAHASAGPLQKVIEIAGPDAVRQVMRDVLEADRKPDGELRQDNVFRYVVAAKGD